MIIWNIAGAILFALFSLRFVMGHYAIKQVGSAYKEVGGENLNELTLIGTNATIAQVVNVLGLILGVLMVQM